MTGDFNEKEEAICTFTSQTVLVSAVGGSGCSHPSPRVDWIFATPNLTQEGFYNAPGSSGGTDHRTVWFSRMRMG